MKTILTAIAILTTWATQAQVTRKVIAEHFTNSYCSVCASRNPGFFTNLHNFPDVLHIAYYPSSPYPACPLNQHNKPEADARTNFYGVYGGTPRLVIEGAVISASASYTDAALFTSVLGQTSAFALSVSIAATSASTGTVTTVIKKVAASTITTVNVYGAIVEDTLFFNAANGENVHYNVFRKSLWGTVPNTVTVPSAVGDSVILTQSFTIHSAWTTARTSAVVMLQDAGKAVLQAEKSGRLAATANVPVVEKCVDIYPNPATNTLVISNLPKGLYRALVTDMAGRTAIDMYTTGTVDIANLSAGTWLLHVFQGDQKSSVLFVKQ
jgi:hypothetical protein